MRKQSAGGRICRRLRAVSAVVFAIFVSAFAQTQGEWQAQPNLSVASSTGAVNYTVVEGDNLWHLAAIYLGDPFLWREIWLHNRWIADPYLIFPGDMIFIPGLSLNVPQPIILPVQEITLFDTSKTLNQINNEVERRVRARNRSFLLDAFRYHISVGAQAQMPFVYEYERVRRGRDRRAYARFRGDGAIRSLANITYEGRAFVRQHQNVRIRIAAQKEEADRYIKPGATLGLFAVRNDIVCRYGVVIQPVGLATVRSTDGIYATIFTDAVWDRIPDGSIAASVREVRAIGETLGYERVFDSLKVQTIARLSADTPIKPFETVFINKGLRDGIVMGDHIAFSALLSHRNSHRALIEREDFFEGLVVGVENGSATVIVTGVLNLTSATSFSGVRIGRIVSRDQ